MLGRPLRLDEELVIAATLVGKAKNAQLQNKWNIGPVLAR